MSDQWTAETFYAALRRAELKPSPLVPTVWLDADDQLWRVGDPKGLTSDELKAIFKKIEERRGRT